MRKKLEMGMGMEMVLLECERILCATGWDVDICSQTLLLLEACGDRVTVLLNMLALGACCPSGFHILPCLVNHCSILVT